MDKSAIQNNDLEELAFEGISVDFHFKSNKPTFGDLFLIVGFENPKFPAKNKEFAKLKELGFEQVDDYFAIKNDTELGDDVKLWLYPIINGNEVYHDEGPFDAIRVTYNIIRNVSKNADLFEKAFYQITTNLDVRPTFDGNTINDYAEIRQTITKTMQYCREILKVEPGSNEALELDW